MAFCPFFPYRDCPANEECKLHNGFGCEFIEKVGKPAVYTNGEEEPVDVLILQMFSQKASINDNILVVYTLASDGSIHLEDDITKFTMHIL